MRVGDVEKGVGLGMQVTRPMAAGSLLPLALNTAFAGDVNEALLDALACACVPAGTLLGFRFYDPLTSYVAATAATLQYVTAADIVPGDVLRLLNTADATVLLHLRFEQCVVPPVVVASVSVPATFIGGTLPSWSCYLFSVPAGGTCCCSSVTGVASVGQTPPPTCVVPCQFQVCTTLPVVDTPYTYVMATVNSSVQGAVPGSWSNAWQVVKYCQWAPLDTDYVGTVNAMESQLYVAPTPGQVVPVAVRPHIADTPFTAQLAVVVTAPLPAGTTFAITAEIAPAADAPVPYWLYTAPADKGVCAGTVLAFSGLAVVEGVTPCVNIGNVVGLPDNWPADDIDLTDFTLFSTAPCFDGAGVRYISVLYTCARDNAQPLPPCIVPGVSAPAAPWPTGPRILPTKACVAVPACEWPCTAQKLLCAAPVPWTCQPTPCFRLCPGAC